MGSQGAREQETLPYLWSAAVNLRCLCQERDMLLDRAEWIYSVVAGIWHQNLPCKEQQDMSQSMPNEVLASAGGSGERAEGIPQQVLPGSSSEGGMIS
jgi:hypothetical protein